MQFNFFGGLEGNLPSGKTQKSTPTKVTKMHFWELRGPAKGYNFLSLRLSILMLAVASGSSFWRIKRRITFLGFLVSNPRLTQCCRLVSYEIFYVSIRLSQRPMTTCSEFENVGLATRFVKSPRLLSIVLWQITRQRPPIVSCWKLPSRAFCSSCKELENMEKWSNGIIRKQIKTKNMTIWLWLRLWLRLCTCLWLWLSLWLRLCLCLWLWFWLCLFVVVIGIVPLYYIQFEFFVVVHRAAWVDPRRKKSCYHDPTRAFDPTLDLSHPTITKKPMWQGWKQKTGSEHILRQNGIE